MSIRPLLSQQKEALSRAIKHDSYALFMDTGTCKTRVAIELIKLLIEANREKRIRTLVVTPLSTIEKVWRPECKMWAEELSFCNLWRERNRGARIPTSDIYGINYESVYRLPIEFLEKIDFIILDESSKIKNPRAGVTKFLLKLSERIERKLILSGTPAPNSPLEYWSQMYFVNPAILGSNYFVYRAKHFFSYGFGGYLWKPKNGFTDSVLPNLLAKQSYAVQKKDCLDLPDQIFEPRAVYMDAEQKRIYNQMLMDNIASFKEYSILGVNELAEIMKLRQITAGFFISEDKKTVDLSNTKLKVLREVIDEIGDKPVIIWCQFHWEIKKIKEMLGDKSAVLYGGIGQSEKERNIQRFLDGEVRYLIAHPKSGGHGHTWVHCSYVIYYSLSYSFEEKKQSEDRVHRYGQVNKVTYFYLLAEGTIDEKIYNALTKKEKMSDAILQMIREAS